MSREPRLAGQQLRGLLPQAALVRHLRQIAIKAQIAGQHPLDIAIQDGHPLAKAQRRNGRGRGAANARQGLQLLRGARKRATVQAHHLPRAAVQVARAAVVAQAGPQVQHIVEPAAAPAPAQWGSAPESAQSSLAP